MTVCGVTSEFNPFHKGHMEPLHYAKETLHSDFTIAFMSGDFVQRGEPALLSKYTRTRCALLAGYDMVIEIPAEGIIKSASDYSSFAINLMKDTNVVTHFVYGAECHDKMTENLIINILSDEPESYKDLIKAELKSGKTYAAARENALISYFHENNMNPEHIHAILSGSNNILGLEYRLAAKKYAPRLKPAPIKRQGGNYHSDELSLSAESIRKYIHSFGNRKSTPEAGPLSDLIPPACFDCFYDEIKNNNFLSLEDFSLILFKKLNLDSYKYLTNSDLDLRIKKMIPEYTGPSEFIEKIKTKNITYTSISRRLLQIILGYNNMVSFHSDLYEKKPEFIRILGFKEEASELLSLIKEKSAVPVIINLSKDINKLTETAEKQLRFDIDSSEIWRTALTVKNKRNYPSEFNIKYPVKV